MVLLRIRILFAAIIGELVKLSYRIYTPSFNNALNKDNSRREKVIISLTSYGRRVNDVLPFALYSLLSQSYKPDKIILWLDENWNNENLPQRITKLKEKRLVEVRYCKDIRSYKKLVPSLELYPDDIIVTFDDDLYYRPNLLKRLIEGHENYPNSIITHRAHRFVIKNHEVLRYDQWEQCISDEMGNDVFPTGGAGCLYKRSLLHEDVINDKLFMELCPLADDVWFFFMEILKKTPRVVLKRKGFVYIPLDDFYQFFHKHSSLASQNEQESMNDVQIRDVMMHYGLTVKDGMVV